MMTMYQNDIHTCHADCQNPICIEARKAVKAFPLLSNWDNNKLNGMDLRDYFAAKTLNALLSTQEVHSGVAEDRITPAEVAQTAYQWADLMMKAREK